MRTEIERYNARFKKMGQERMWVRSMNAVQKLSTLAHISLLAVATAAVLTLRPSLKLSQILYAFCIRLVFFAFLPSDREAFSACFLLKGLFRKLHFAHLTIKLIDPIIYSSYSRVHNTFPKNRKRTSTSC